MRDLPAFSPLPAAAIAGALAGRLRPAVETEAARALVASVLHAETAILTDSGRSALRLAIDSALATRRDRRVIALPAFQCYEVATAAVGAECDIVLYDIDPRTLRPDIDSVAAALRHGPAALVVAPLYGLPVDWPALSRMAAAHGALLIEDAAQADGAELRGQLLGTLGSVSVVSFGRGKGWSGGGGGALLLRSGGQPDAGDRRPRLPVMDVAREWKTAVTAILQASFGRPSLYGIPAAIPALALGETRYHEPTIPEAIAPFSAALLRRTLDAARREAALRRDNANRWRQSIPAALAAGIPPVIDGGVPGYLRFPLRLAPESVDRALAPEGLRAGIAPSFPLPLGRLSALSARLVGPAQLPGASALARQLVTLPTHSRLTSGGRARIAAILATLRSPDD